MAIDFEFLSFDCNECPQECGTPFAWIALRWFALVHPCWDSGYWLFWWVQSGWTNFSFSDCFFIQAIGRLSHSLCNPANLYCWKAHWWLFWLIWSCGLITGSCFQSPLFYSESPVVGAMNQFFLVYLARSLQYFFLVLKLLFISCSQSCQFKYFCCCTWCFWRFANDLLAVASDHPSLWFAIWLVWPCFHLDVFLCFHLEWTLANRPPSEALPLSILCHLIPLIAMCCIPLRTDQSMISLCLKLSCYGWCSQCCNCWTSFHSLDDLHSLPMVLLSPVSDWFLPSFCCYWVWPSTTT